jgi:hypothetical protein
MTVQRQRQTVPHDIRVGDLGLYFIRGAYRASLLVMNVGEDGVYDCLYRNACGDASLHRMIPERVVNWFYNDFAQEHMTKVIRCEDE